jgi:cell division septation protein DedD
LIAILIENNKQRIVGSVVLLVLAIILSPVIFDGQGSYESQLVSRIPDEPVVEILAEPVQVRPVIIADTENNKLAVIDEEVISSEDTPPIPSLPENSELDDQIPGLDASGLPRGWSIRLGSFAEVTNASNLVDRLRQSGYKAYTNIITNPAGDLTSVLVGPWLDPDLADKYREELQDEFMLAGVVVRYEINQQ